MRTDEKMIGINSRDHIEKESTVRTWGYPILFILKAAKVWMGVGRN